MLKLFVWMSETQNAVGLFCAGYKSPGKCGETEFITALSKATETMYNVRNEWQFLGDFNMDLYDKDDRTPNKTLLYLC